MYVCTSHISKIREIPQIPEMQFEHEMIRKVTKKPDVLLKVARSRMFIFVPISKSHEITIRQLFYLPNWKS